MPLKREAMPLLDARRRLGRGSPARPTPWCSSRRRARRRQHRRARRGRRRSARRTTGPVDARGRARRGSHRGVGAARPGRARRARSRLLVARPGPGGGDLEAVAAARHPTRGRGRAARPTSRDVRRRRASSRRSRPRPRPEVAGGGAPTCRSSSRSLYDPWPTPLAAAAVADRRAGRSGSTCWCTRRSTAVRAMTGRSTRRSPRCAPPARRDSPNAVAEDPAPDECLAVDSTLLAVAARDRAGRARRPAGAGADRPGPRPGRRAGGAEPTRRPRPRRRHRRCDADRPTGGSAQAALRRHRRACPGSAGRARSRRRSPVAIVGLRRRLDLGAACCWSAGPGLRWRWPSSTGAPGCCPRRIIARRTPCWSCWCSPAGRSPATRDALVRAALGWLVAARLVLLAAVADLPARAGVRRRPPGRGARASRSASWAGARCSSGCTPASCSAGSSAVLLSVLPDRGRARAFPFGPFMLLGALVGLLWGEPIWSASSRADQAVGGLRPGMED